MLEEKTSTTCEKCEQESHHVIKSMGTDNRPHYICWSCLTREEKGVNLSQTWKRGGRQARLSSNK